MSKKTEMGYHNNAANFKALIQYVTNWSTQYNPSKTTITITALEDADQATDLALQEVQTQKANLIVAVNDRQIAFGAIPKLATRIVNAMDATDIPDLLIKDARGILAKIRGTSSRKSKDIQPDEQGNVSNNTISTSRRSYDSILENYSMLLTIVEQQADYQPNENDLKINTLKALLPQLHTLNNAVNEGVILLANARYERDAAFYMPNTGILPRVRDVKAYAKSIFGADSRQYKLLAA